MTIRTKAAHYLLALSLCLAMWFVPNSSLALDFTRRTNFQIGSAVVQLTVYNWRGAFVRQGWGFFVNKEGDIVTCRHLLEGGHLVEATSITGETVTVEKVLAENVEGSFVRVGLEYIPEKMVYLTEAAKFPNAGERVLVGGGQGCEPGAFMDGTVESVRKVPVFGLMMKIITPFSSVGSPVFNEDGKLVGVVLIKLENYGGTAWVVPVGKTAGLLKDAENPVNYDEWSERQTKPWLETPTGSYMKGFVNYWAGDFKAAAPFLEAAARDDRFSKEAYFLLGCCSDAMESYEKSVAAYSMAARLDPDSENIYVKLAQARMKNGDYTGSIDSCWKALHLKPDNYDAFLLLSRVYNAQSDFQKALAMSYGALRIRPNCPHAFVEAGIAFRSMNRFPDAIRLFQKAIAIQNDLEKAYWHLALTHFYRGDVDSAMKVCDALKTFNPEMSEKLYAGIAR